MNLLTNKKTELLNQYQRELIEDALKNKRDYMLIVTDENNMLKIVNYCSINDLYDFLFVNYYKLNYRALRKVNDDYTLDIVDILLDLIKKELDLNSLYHNVLINVNEMLHKYDDYVIQYTYENYLEKCYEYHSTRSLLKFIDTIKKNKSFIFHTNQLLLDACKHVVNNDIDIYSWLGVDIL